MAAATVTSLGLVASGTGKTSGTTLRVTFNQNVPADTLLYIGLGYDNHASTTQATVTIPTIGGVTPNGRNGGGGSGQTTTAGTGVWFRSWSARITNAINSGDYFDLTFGNAVVAKACAVLGLTNLTDSPRGIVKAYASTTGVPSGATAGTALVTGDVVIGFIAGENHHFLVAIPTHLTVLGLL